MYEINGGKLTAFKGASGWNKNDTAVIPDGVTEICACAFCDCQDLVRVVIPESVTAIGDLAFCECKSLQHVNIPDNVRTIGAGAFGNCCALEDLMIPDGVLVIHQRLPFAGEHPDSGKRDLHRAGCVPKL